MTTVRLATLVVKVRMAATLVVKVRMATLYPKLGLSIQNLAGLLKRDSKIHLLVLILKILMKKNLVLNLIRIVAQGQNSQPDFWI